MSGHELGPRKTGSCCYYSYRPLSIIGRAGLEKKGVHRRPTMMTRGHVGRGLFVICQYVCDVKMGS
jgi:hypothetical protein